ncbi:NAD(P)-binding protein [Xylogone sp. PMI_703]|nr:NAD(P)-binding protein [Xylogone sp. PMI_703]
MARLIAVTGATGNQGGSVAKLLLKYPDEYKVRAITRDANSPPARALRELGAEIVEADLTKPETLPAAVAGCWGVFGVTNFYDSKIKGDPGSEEVQGKNLVKASYDARVRCFIWSSLPSSAQISGGRLVSRIYEGKHHVDAYIKEIGLPASILYTGNFYENLVLRGHVTYNKAEDIIEFRHTVVKRDTRMAMLYVEKDLSAVVKAVFDQWESEKETLNHKILYCASSRVTPGEIIDCIEKVTGKKCSWESLPTTGVPDRDIMYQLYNEMGMYGNKELPDENIVALGVKMHNTEDYVRERLLPHLGL